MKKSWVLDNAHAWLENLDSSFTGVYSVFQNDKHEKASVNEFILEIC
jgi:hypothetical protein